MTTALWLSLALLLALAAGALLGGFVPSLRRPNKPATVVLDSRTADLIAAGLLPLSDCPRDCQACLRCIRVDRCVIHRLVELGLTPGVELSVVQDNGGSMLVSVRGSRVALGRELAENLWVEMRPLPFDR